VLAVVDRMTYRKRRRSSAKNVQCGEADGLCDDQRETAVSRGSPLNARPRARALFTTSLALFANCVPGGDPPQDAALPGWELVWADEFDGPVLDQGSWTPEVMPDPYNEELQYYTDRVDAAPGANAWLEDGALVIEARREDFAHRRYTSARLITKGKREFRYGRFAARIRQPGEVGLWPAFWLLGGNIDEVGWPRCGEIDVMEGKGRLPDWTSGALHRGPDPSRNRITAAEYRLPFGSFQDAWHEFAVEWEPERIRWFVDGVPFQTVEKTPGDDAAYWPFDEGHSFFLILNLAVGGWFDAPHLPPDDITPQRLSVDYVRVYRRASDGEPEAR
jgi:beta-glucanase (GH16 family)